MNYKELIQGPLSEWDLGLATELILALGSINKAGAYLDQQGYKVWPCLDSIALALRSYLTDQRG